MRLESKNKLYHYCKLSTAIEYILPKRELILSKLSKTNDPRENKSFVFAATFDNESDFKDLKTNNKEVSDKLRKGCKIICFSHDSNFFGYEYSKMWAHYGDNHRGICIELDKQKFIEENSSMINPDLLKEINYFEFDYRKPQDEHKMVDFVKMKNTGTDKYLNEEFRMQHLDYLYYTKDIDWKSERETRLLYFSKKEEIDEFCTIKNSINHIYLGVNFCQHYLPSLKNICPDVSISELEYEEVRLIAKIIFEPHK